MIDVLSDVCGGAIINLPTDAPTIDLLSMTDVSLWIDIAVGILEITVLTFGAISVELVPSVSCGVDVISGVIIDVLVGVMIVFVTSIGVDVLADAKVIKNLAAVMTDFEFLVPVPLVQSRLFC